MFKITYSLWVSPVCHISYLFCSCSWHSNRAGNGRVIESINVSLCPDPVFNIGNGLSDGPGQDLVVVLVGHSPLPSWCYGGPANKPSLLLETWRSGTCHSPPFRLLGPFRLPAILFISPEVPWKFGMPCSPYKVVPYGTLLEPRPCHPGRSRQTFLCADTCPVPQSHLFSLALPTLFYLVGYWEEKAHGLSVSGILSQFHCDFPWPRIFPGKVPSLSSYFQTASIPKLSDFLSPGPVPFHLTPFACQHQPGAVHKQDSPASLSKQDLKGVRLQQWLYWAALEGNKTPKNLYLCLLLSVKSGREF